jgi:hypothetical protein
MSESDTSASPPSLSSLNLRIGQAVQVILQGPQIYKHYTRLVGFAEPEFVILRVPTEKGWGIPISNGQRLDVRLFSEVSLFEFSSSVQTFQLHPRNFMVIDYPRSLHETRYRDHARVACHLPAQVVMSPIGQVSGFVIKDLSGRGASLLGSQRLGQPGEPLTLEFSFRLNAMDSLEHIHLQAKIQSVEPGDTTEASPATYRHGIRFDSADPRLFLLVFELQKNR